VSDAKPQLPAAPVNARLIGATFSGSIPFGGEALAVQLGRNVEAILPAVLAPDGSATPIKDGQRADGVLLRQRTHDRLRGTWYTAQEFVPWANVKGLQYGP